MSVEDWRDRFKKYDPRRRLETQPSTGDGRTQYGFRWGPFEIQRTVSAERRPGQGHTRVVSIVTDAGHLLEAYVSPTGRSIRVWLDHQELKKPSAEDRVSSLPDKWICSICGTGLQVKMGYWIHTCEGQGEPRGGPRNADGSKS